MRILTAGESHGKALVTVIEGFPQGVIIKENLINTELKRRMSGTGRGRRMVIEQDKVSVIAGMRNGVTLGSPLCMMVENKDQRILPFSDDKQAPLLVPRPGHADLAGCLKYGFHDIRNVLERASARETVSRVCAGSVCKQFLSVFGISIASFVVSVGNIVSSQKPKSISEITKRKKNSGLGAIDRRAETLMLAAIKKAQDSGDSLGGIIEIWAEGMIPGLGSFMHFDKRIDARLAGSLMSIPSVKGVEAGAGFDYARMTGSVSHDAIYYSRQRKFYRNTNNSGGIEAGVTNGSPLVLRIAAKPIPTLLTPLNSVHLLNKTCKKAIVERTDTCVITAIGVIAEAMVAIVLTECMLDKFGEDSFSHIQANFKQYRKNLV